MGQTSKHQDSARRRVEAERSAREHRANVNQIRHEPMPASHYDDSDQAAVNRNQEHAADSAPDGRQDGAARHAAEWPAEEWHQGSAAGEQDDDAARD